MLLLMSPESPWFRWKNLNPICFLNELRLRLIRVNIQLSVLFSSSSQWNGHSSCLKIFSSDSSWTSRLQYILRGIISVFDWFCVLNFPVSFVINGNTNIFNTQKYNRPNGILGKTYDQICPKMLRLDYKMFYQGLYCCMTLKQGPWENGNESKRHKYIPQITLKCFTWDKKSAK